MDNIRQYSALANQPDSLIYCAFGLEMWIDDFPAGAPFILYEPRIFTYYMYGWDTRFAEMTELARRAKKIVCCDDTSRQWWSRFNSNAYLLGEGAESTAPTALEIRIAQMIVEDYLTGCDYAVRHRFGLWGKVKRYYKEFGLRQTLHRVYEKLSGQEDDD